MPLSACTISSRNYLARARVLADSYLEHNPGAKVYLLLVDRLETGFDAGFDTGREPFELVSIESLTNLPDLESFLFKYDRLQACTAAKPYLLAYLLERFDLARLVYLDPDMQVLGPFAELDPLLATHSAVLTPHLTSPLEDGAYPDELAILAAGTYNLGFLGLRRCAETSDLLDWWQRRVYDACFADPEAGCFVDQRWIDLAPGLCKGIHVLTHPGYNVAHWNLHDREIDLSPAGARANGEPLRCFHFSGLEPECPEIVSRHQDRYRLRDLETVAPLFHRYRDLLLAAGDREWRRSPYAYDSFDDGTPIEAAARSLYAALGERRRRFGDPFSTSHPGCFKRWLETGGRASLRRHARELEVPLRSRLARRGVPALRRLLGPPSTRRLLSGVRSLLPPMRRQLGRLASASATRRLEPFGVNLVGYLHSESGMGQAARSLAATLAAADVPHSLHAVDLNDPAPQSDSSYPVCESSFPYAINLFCINADQMPQLVDHLGPEVLADRYSVGYWLWELDSFPERFRSSFADLDEVWTPSSFSLQAIAAISPVPVRRLPLAVDLEPGDGERARRQLGLPARSWLALSIFSFLGYGERKNPLAAIRAFRQAFAPDDDVRLVLKSAHPELVAGDRERVAAEVDGQVCWVDQSLSRQQTYDLIAACDAYVSLHRGEGFGLTVAEAMHLGRPVVATPYGGVCDFFDLNTGLPVGYRMVAIERAVGPYPRGAQWADPDVDDAARKIRRLYDEPQLAARLGERAREQVARLLSTQAVAAILRRHLESVLRRGSS